MSDTNGTQDKQKAVKVRRKPERESVLRPMFAATRHGTSGTLWDRDQQGSGLLQRQCACGTHTIGGGGCEACKQKRDTGVQVPPEEMGDQGTQQIQAFSDRSFGFDFSTIPTHSTTGSQQFIQASLNVNAPGDQYEQEADRVADAVMRMPASPFTPSINNLKSWINPTVSHLPAISRIQTSGGKGGFQAPSSIEERINRMQSGGRSLPDKERSFFEERMGYDFSGVRVHTDANAVQASRDIQARAFTLGNNIAFNQGAYRPETDAGRRLLAHELTHVVQQGAAGVQRKPLISRLMNKSQKSQVLRQLQVLQQQSDVDTSLHRKEIAEFQRSHSAEEIADMQRQLFDGEPNVAIQERDNSRTLRRQDDCACCVNDVKIENISRIDNTRHMGHSFDAVIAMEYPAGASGSGLQSCTLEWWEKTNVPYAASLGQRANTWHDMFAMIPNSPTLAPWVNRAEACETSSGVTITDPPALGKRTGRNVTRTLEFNIKVKSAAGGSCTNQEKAVTATQVLKMVNGAPDWSGSSFVTP